MLLLIIVAVHTNCTKKYICPAYYSAFHIEPCVPLIDSTARLYVRTPLPASKQVHKRDTIYDIRIEINYKDSSITLTRTVHFELPTPPEMFTAFQRDMPQSDPIPVRPLVIERDKYNLIKPMSNKKKDKMLATVKMEKHFSCCQDSGEVKDPIRKIEWDFETDNTKIK